MEGYKRYLCINAFGLVCASEDRILNFVHDNLGFAWHMNKKDELHSDYSENGYYRPAVVWRDEKFTRLIWLFNGKIRDCLHPFSIVYNTKTKRIKQILYYSSERIRCKLPINLKYDENQTCEMAEYNQYECGTKFVKIIDDPELLPIWIRNPPQPFYAFYEIKEDNYAIKAEDYDSATHCPFWVNMDRAE